MTIKYEMPIVQCVLVCFANTHCFLNSIKGLHDLCVCVCVHTPHIKNLMISTTYDVCAHTLLRSVPYTYAALGKSTPTNMSISDLSKENEHLRSFKRE